MTYDLSKEYDLLRMTARLETLKQRGSVVELTEKTFRSTAQNRYLHALLGVVALEVGEPLEYVKRYYFKYLVNPTIFVEEKDDPRAGRIKMLRSSADLTTEEMTEAIDHFWRWGTDQGWYMPCPEDEAIIREIEIEMSRQRRNIYD